MLSESLESQFTQAMDAFGPYPTYRHIWAVAVSGGADSLALLLLANQYAQSRHGKVIALTVDHRLRPESTAEAEQVAIWAKAYDIEHHILTWEHPPVISHLQAQAREARYSLLAAWCRQQGVWHLLTAHHADDQMETVLMRQWRKSGTTGLAGIPATRIWQQICLLRPLLLCSPLCLKQWLQAKNQPWIEDPSNQSMDYTRIQARHALANAGTSLWEQLNTLSMQATNKRVMHEQQMATWMAQYLIFSPLGFAHVHYSTLDTLAIEAQLMIMSQIIAVIGGHLQMSRANSLLLLLQALHNDASGVKTLGGCIWHWQQDKKLMVYREPVAIPAYTILKKTNTTWWDHRFHITLHETAPDDQIIISPLTLQWINQHRSQLPILKHLPKCVLSTLPALVHLEKVVSVPHIEYYQQSFWRQAVQIQLAPPRPLAGQQFQSIGIVFKEKRLYTNNIGMQ